MRYSICNFRPVKVKWTHPFPRKTKSGFYVCAIIFKTVYHLGINGRIQEHGSDKGRECKPWTVTNYQKTVSQDQFFSKHFESSFSLMLPPTSVDATICIMCGPLSRTVRISIRLTLWEKQQKTPQASGLWLHEVLHHNLNSGNTSEDLLLNNFINNYKLTATHKQQVSCSLRPLPNR